MYRAYWYYQAFILSNGFTIKYSKKYIKIYIKINIKIAPTCFGFNNHHQGAWHLCFAKVIIIKIVSWNTSLKYISAMWLHIISSNIWCVNSALCGVSESYNPQCTVHTPNRTGYTTYMQPHYRNIFKSHISFDYLNDYNFSEVKMPRSLMMFDEN